MAAGRSALTYGVSTSQQASVGGSSTGVSAAGGGAEQAVPSEHMIESVNPWSMATEQKSLGHQAPCVCLF